MSVADRTNTMAHVTIRIDTRLINDWSSFHHVFKQQFGFPEFYGSNMNAWIDCMSSLDDPEAGMSKVHVQKGGVLVIELDALTVSRSDVRRFTRGSRNAPLL